MPQFRATKLVSVPPAVAFDVASDVGAYREFLPLLESSTVQGGVKESGGIKEFSAELSVAYPRLGLRERFVSRVVCDRNNLTVRSASQDPPFRNMKALWSIRDDGGRANVSISIEYEMRSRLLQLALASALEVAIGKVLASFEKRAKEYHAAASSSI